MPEGQVISQSIDAGTNIQRGDEVTLIVSSGKPTIIVADVVGKPQADAENELKAQGFKVTVLENYSDTVPAGYVISQNPAAGQSQLEGATITISVSKGTQTVSVSGVKLNKSTLYLVTGASETLTAEVLPSNASNKRFYRDEKRKCIRLHPENKHMADIFVEKCYIQGVARHVIKKLE